MGDLNMTTTPRKSNTRELFRFARIRKPRIFELESRLLENPTGKTWLKKKGKERLSLLRAFARSGDYVRSMEQLSQDYLRGLSIDALHLRRLPSRDDIACPKEFQEAVARGWGKLDADLQRSLLSLHAAVVLNKKEDAAFLTRLVQFLELWTNLESARERRPYAPLVTSRFVARSPDPQEEAETPPIVAIETDEEASQLDSGSVLDLWTAANRFKEQKIEAIQQAQQEIRKTRPTPPPQSQEQTPETKARGARLARSNSRTNVEVAQRRQKIAELRQELKQVRSLSGIELARAMVDDQEHMKRLGNAAKSLALAMASASAVKAPAPIAGFCDLYRRIKNEEENPTPVREDCGLAIKDPCLRKIASRRHRVDGADSIKPLGEAELVVVEERWVEYTPGEINRIETVFKNEKRAKSVDVEKIFEQTQESFQEEVSDNESESQATTSMDLKSEIQNELSSRFDSNINASASGSGGGSIGVVDFAGEGSVASNIGIGIDTSMTSSETSSFSSEIIERALEKTRTTTSERRSSRTFNRYATNYTYEVDNTQGNSEHINGVYVFLDKHICITERQYGIRQFLIADLMHPGHSLLEHALMRQVANLSDTGEPPLFDLSPAEINEHNYLALCGRFKAANVEIPPPLIKMQSTVYKTDTSNETREHNDSKFRDVVDVLVPFFGKYKRFLIQDTLEIPDGYRVQDVRVTVSHGSNGVSIPAHLPFTLGGALAFAMPKLMVSAIPTYALFYLPIALYEIIYLASPVLHYNADSSNVTVTVGHTSKESPYFFFQPDELIAGITSIMAEFPDLSNDVLTQVQALIGEFVTTFTGNVTDTFDDGLVGPFNTLRSKLIELMEVVKIIAKPVHGQVPSTGEVADVAEFFGSGLQTFIDAMTAAGIDFTTLFAPIGELVQSLINVIGQDLLDAFRAELEELLSMLENTDPLQFTENQALTGTLPVSFNCIALKPGITINLTACMVRIEDQALDAWRLQTHERLYAAYRQLAAEYETRLLMKSKALARATSPAKLRDIERRVIKDRVFQILKAQSSAPDTHLTLDESKLFEHALDWDNVSYRLYNHAPTGAELVQEKLGLYHGADDRRRAFLDATWAQILIPLKNQDVLESMMMAFMLTGETATLDELIDTGALPDGELDEIAALYRDIILRRELLAEEPRESHREEVVPTDLVMIYDGVDQTSLPIDADAQADLDGS
jgi:hypothetical protein